MASAILSLVLAASAATSTPAKPPAKQPDSASAKDKKAEAAKTEPKNDVAKADTAAAKSELKPAPVPAGRSPKSAARPSQPLRGEVFVAPSIASLGEEWANAMSGDEIGTEADRKVWSPAFAFGTRTPFFGALALEVDGSATRFSAPVPGGRTEGWVGHAAGRAAYERGRFGGELGVLVRVADLTTPESSSNAAPRLLPSAEVHVTSATSGTETFLAAWDNPLLPYGDEGWLRAGARKDFGRLSGELAVGIDPIFAGEDATGPVLESRIEVRAGRGFRLGMALRAADEPMAAFVVRRVFD